MGGFNPAGTPNTVCHPLGLVTTPPKHIPDDVKENAMQLDSMASWLLSSSSLFLSVCKLRQLPNDKWLLLGEFCTWHQINSMLNEQLPPWQHQRTEWLPSWAFFLDVAVVELTNANRAAEVNSLSHRVCRDAAFWVAGFCIFCFTFRWWWMRLPLIVIELPLVNMVRNAIYHIDQWLLNPITFIVTNSSSVTRPLPLVLMRRFLRVGTKRF